MKKFLFILIAAFLLVPGLYSCDEDKNPKNGDTSAQSDSDNSAPVAIGLNLEEGKTYRFSMATDQAMNVQSVQGLIKTNTKMGYEFSYKVNSVNGEGVAAITIKYENIFYETVTPQGSLSYDSKNPPAQMPPGLKGYAAVLGNSFDIELSPQGKVNAVTGLDKIVEAILALGDFKSPEEKTMAERQVRSQFSVDIMSQNVENIFFFFPGKDVAVGDSWVKENYITAGVPRIMNYTWTLESVENGLATISANATIKNDPTMSKQAQGEMVREIKAVGQQAGTIVVDINTGWVQTVDMEQTYQSTVTVTGAPDTDQPQVQTVEMKSVETYRSL
ncbi:MAG: DUF6263 family protein [Candidatus Kapabacteria bacterium]|nr:DUF6263 family protein [Candidatus Kapabacteria bacterium]